MPGRDGETEAEVVDAVRRRAIAAVGRVKGLGCGALPDAVGEMVLQALRTDGLD